MSKKWSIAYLYLPIAIIVLLDIALTFDGNLPHFLDRTKIIREISPVGRAFISVGPATFIFASMLYVAAIFMLLWRLSEYKKLALFFSLIFAHGNAGLGWLVSGLRESLCVNAHGTTSCTTGHDTALWIFSILAALLFGLVCAWAIKAYYATQSSLDD
ncbi:MAG: hypothetical protein Q7S09_02035 [bacterium]|nr:hypothetical protein [bacterium]